MSDLTYDFYIDRADEGTIAGWIWRPDVPAERVAVELLVEDRVVAETTADEFRQDLLDAGKGDGFCAFSIDLPRDLAGTPQTVSLRPRGQSVTFFSCELDYKQPPLFAATTDRLTLDFNVERTDDRAIIGWIWRPAAPNDRVVVELLLDGRVVAETTADQFRQDLLDAGKGDGFCFFKIEIPDQLRDGHEHKLALRGRDFSEPFHELGARRLTFPSFWFDSFSPVEMSGSCWFPHNPSANVTIEISIQGKTVHTCNTDHLNRFSYSMSLESIRSLVEGIGVNDVHETAVCVRANGLELKNEKIDTIVTETQTYVFFIGSGQIEDFSLKAISLGGRQSNTLRLYLNDNVVSECTFRETGEIQLDLGHANARDGINRIIVTSLSSDRKEVVEFTQDRDFSRWEVSCDIDGDRVKGVIVDRWHEPVPLAVELLVDGAAVGVVPASKSPSEPTRRFNYAFPIASRFRDGKPHSVNVRVIGTTRLWPERGVLFKAGTPEKNVLFRHELADDGTLTGFVVLPWDRAAVATVELHANGSLLERREADEWSPVLAAEQVLPESRAFIFKLPSPTPENLRISAHYEEELLVDRSVSYDPPAPFQLKDPGFGHEGICFVLDDPHSSIENLEDARELLIAAANVARVSDQPLTIMLAHLRSATQPTPSLESWISDLIGRDNSELLSTARYVYLPQPVLASTPAKAQFPAYSLDLWLRACRYALVLGPSRGGIMAYSCQSRLEGLLNNVTKIGLLVGGFIVDDVIANDRLLDDPELLNTEALERLALGTAQYLWSTHVDAAETVSKILPEAAPKIVTANLDIGPISVAPLGRNLDRCSKWLVAAGPLTSAQGLGQLCDALDRLGRTMAKDATSLGVAIIGPEGVVRGGRASTYIRNRARNWPFQIAVHIDLTFDSVAEVLADYSAAAQGLVFGGANNALWTDLMTKSGVPPVLGVTHNDNPTALAKRLSTLITEGGASKPELAQPVKRAATSLADLIHKTAAAEINLPFVDTDENTTSLSVCISHFNRPTFLRQTLSSLRACEYPKLEVIVVDDGSETFGVKDELSAIADEFNDLSVRVVHQPNSYLGAARNTAARNATGELLIFMDDDNVARPDMIEGFLSAQRASGAGIITARFAFCEEADDVRIGNTVPRRIGVPLAPDLAVAVFANGYGDANMMVRREAFDRIGGFTEDYGIGHEDWEFFTAAQVLGVKHYSSNRILFDYRVGAQSMLRGRERVERDLLRNIRGFSREQRPELYRIAQLAQGLIWRWGNPPSSGAQPVRPSTSVARRLAFGRVAVVMRTKDRPLLLERALDSVLNQTFTDWTLVVVNDGGDPAPIRRLLEARRLRLQGRELLINNPTSVGMENASNSAITNSSSEFVVVHDDDDSWDPHFLERCVNHLDNCSTDVGGVITHATVIVEDIEGDTVIERQRFLFDNMEALDLSKLAIENQFPPISFLFRRSVLESVGQFDGELPVLGDWDFHLRVATAYPLDVIREPLALYHHRTAGTTNAYGNTVVAQKDMHRIQRAHYINRRLRESLTQHSEAGSGQLLYLGELRRDVSGRIQEVRQHMHWIEKLLNDRGEHMLYIEKMIDQQRQHISDLDQLIREKLR